MARAGDHHRRAPAGEVTLWCALPSPKRPSSDRPDAPARQHQFREQDQRARPAIDLARPCDGGRLRAMRGPGESYSDVILRIAGQ